MAGSLPIIPSSFETYMDEQSGAGKRPVVFDVLAPDRETSLLPGDLKLVLHVNPRSMRLGYQKNIVRIRTRGGYVEQHWGDALEDINFEMATGGFVRLYSGLSNKTGSSGAGTLQGTGAELTAVQGRRETIAYDRFLDVLALFHCNGAIYDANGNLAIQGYIKVSFDGGIHIGWFDTDFTLTEAAESPYQFSLTTRFIIDREEMQLRSTLLNSITDTFSPAFGGAIAEQPLFGEAGLDPASGQIGIRRNSGFTS